MARRKSPRVLAAVLIATSVAAISYKIYDVLAGPASAYLPENDNKKGPRAVSKYRKNHKNIAVTLSHSVLSSGLPLSDILLSSENVTFILPPYLSVDDLAGQIESEGGDVYELPQALIKNYKLLKCSNIDGYFHLLKNLRPDMLFECSDDLGIRGRSPPDLPRFVKETVTIDQDKNEVYTVLADVFLQ